MPVKSHTVKKIKYAFVGINSKQNNTAFSNLNVSPLYHLSERDMNTRSHFDWLLHFTSARRREKFVLIVVGQDGLFQPVNILDQMSNSNPFQSFKMNCLFSPSSS